MRTFVRDIVLVAVAVAVGWWLRSADTAVLARSGAAESDLAFQFNGSGAEASLSLYNPANRTLYVYPRVGTGNAYIQCEYSFAISEPGRGIKRENCPIGQQAPPR